MRGLYIFDTEGDDLYPQITKFHVLCFKEYGRDNWLVFLDENHNEYKLAKDFCENTRGESITIHSFSNFNNWVIQDSVKGIACHNMYGFDLPAMNRLLGTEYDMFPETINGSPTKLFDTLSMSQGLYPDRQLPHGCPASVKCPVTNKSKNVGPHGLQAWGYRVSNMKPHIDDWRNQPLCTYINRCIEDVLINERVWTELVKEMQVDPKYKIDWKVPLRRKLEEDYLMKLQERTGVPFNINAAEKLLAKADRMMKDLEEEVEPLLPERQLPKSQQPNFPSEPFKQDGSISSHGYNWLRRLGYQLNEEVLNCNPPPKTAFKKGGVELSKAGENYCIKNGIENKEDMPDYIRSQLNLSRANVFISVETEYKAKEDLRNKVMPKLTEPMRLANQQDIKQYLVESEGWKPTLWGTKDITKDKFKRAVSKDIQEEKIKDYIQNVINSPFRELILLELGVTGKTQKLDFYATKSNIVNSLLRKARYLVTTPKFKDERGELCPNLELLKGDMASKIVKWLSLRNRRSVIKAFDEKKETGWLNNERLERDGRLGATATATTNTFRSKHSVVVNVPKADPDVLLGKEMRSLFYAPEGYWQIGTDASNLEGFVAAWLAYKYDKGDYYNGLSGDPHTENAKAYSEAAGKEISRGGGKPLTYAIMYGAQSPKVANMLGVSKEVGQRVIDAYWDTNFGLKAAKEALEKYWEATGKKFIRGIDGRKIYTRSKHSLLNADIQSTGAILMSLAGTIWHKEANKNNLLTKGVDRVIYMHDEYQHLIKDNLVRWKEFDTEEEAKEFEVKGRILSGNVVQLNNKYCRAWTLAGELQVKAIEQAAEELGCPFKITGEYLIGKNWAECH